MSKKKELVKNTFIILIGKICTQFLSFFLLPLYTSVLSSSEYGTVDLISTYITLMVPIITLQLEMALFRELIETRENKFEKTKIISSGLASVFVQFLVCLIVYLVINMFIKIPYAYYILFSTITMMLSNLFLQISRGNGDNIGYSIGSVIAGVSTIIFNIVFLVVLDFKAEGMLLATALGNALSAIFLFFRNKLYKFIDVKFISKNIQKRLLKYSWPLVPNGLIWWIINVSDRTIITWILGAGANGIYAVSNKFSTILIQLYNIFNLSWTESAAVNINDSDRNSFFSDTFNTTIKLFGSMCILLISGLPLVFKLFVNESFDNAYKYIPILLIGMMFNIIVSFIGSIYVAKKLTKEVSKTSLWSGILNILINVLLIKFIGIYAAAISTLIAFLIMSIYRYIDVQKYVKLKLNTKMVGYLIVLIITASIVYYIRNLYFILINLIVCGTVLIYINRNMFFIIKNKIKKVLYN